MKISLNDNNPTSHFIFEIQHFDDNIKIILNSLASELVKNNHEFYHWVVFYLNIDVQEDDDDNNSVISNLNNEFNEIYTETYKQTQKKNPIVIGEIESDSSLTPYKNLLLKLQQYTNIYLDIQELCSILLMIDDLDIETNSIIISNDVNDRIDDLLQHINDQNQNTHYDIEKDENTFYDKSERNSYTYIKMLIENFYEDNAKNMKTSNSPDIKKENLIYLIKNFDYTDEAVMNYLEDFVKNPLSLKQQKRKRPQQKLQQQRQQNGGQKKKRSPRCLPRIYKDQEYNQIVKKYPEERARTSRTSTLIENGIKTSQFTERDKWAHRYGGNNLCLTKMEKEEAYRLKQSKNYEELRTFFQNIRNMYGDGFNSITPKKKSSVSSTVMKSKKVKTPLLQTKTPVSQTKTLCKSRQVSADEYNRLKEKYSRKLTKEGNIFLDKIAIKEKGKTKHGKGNIKLNYVKVNNFKGMCLTYEEITELSKLNQDSQDYKKKMELYKKYKPVQTKSGCSPIEVSSKEYSRLLEKYKNNLNKVEVKGKKNKNKVKTSDYNRSGICVTYDERLQLIAANKNRNNNIYNKIIERARKRTQASKQPRSQSSSKAPSLRLQRSQSSSKAPSLRLQRSQSSSKAPSLRLQRSQSSSKAPSLRLQRSQSSTKAPSLRLQRSQSSSKAPSLRLQRSQSSSKAPSLRLQRSQSSSKARSLQRSQPSSKAPSLQRSQSSSSTWYISSSESE